jgi:hypothetical protein
LIGVDRGEWGGSLTLLTDEGHPPRKLLDGPVLQIIPVATGFLITTGSLTRNVGTLWLYSRADTQEWIVEKKADLRGYPLAVLETTSGIWLADGDSIYRLDDRFNIHDLFDMPWLQLHPNSIAADNSGAIYVGMQAFVVRLTPTETGYRREWFAGNGCFR